MNIKPVSLIPRIASSIGLSRRQIECGRELSNRLHSLGIFDGALPQSIAAVSLLISSYLVMEYIDIDLLLKVSNISLSTLRKYYKQSLECLHHVLPIQLVQQYSSPHDCLSQTKDSGLNPTLLKPGSSNHDSYQDILNNLPKTLDKSAVMKLEQLISKHITTDNVSESSIVSSNNGESTDSSQLSQNSFIFESFEKKRFSENAISIPRKRPLSKLFTADFPDSNNVNKYQNRCR